jgi:nicotinate-nucleotide adenylyltransferase
MRLGVFGGTFDPIHVGHVAAAHAALTALHLERVLFVPSGRPPHKEGHASAEQRYEMTCLAIEGEPLFTVSRLELDRPGPSYTVDTLRALQGDELFFICGADAIVELPTWHEWRELVKLAKFVAVTRPGTTGTRAAYASYLTVPGVDVSSREIRDRVAMGLSITGLVAPAVEAYIREHRLYVA